MSLYISRHGFASLALVADHSCLYVRESKRKCFSPLGFVHLMFHASNVLSEVSPLRLLGMLHLSVVTSDFKVFYKACFFFCMLKHISLRVSVIFP